MENKKNYRENELVKNFEKDYKSATKKAYDATKQSGNNGFQVGQTFTLTGEIDYKVTEIGKSKTCYWYLKTVQGVELSLKTLMGVSSLKGYDLENTVKIEYYRGTPNTDTFEKKTRDVKSDLAEDFDFENVWQPPTRNILDLAGMIAEGDCDLSNKEVTFLGTAVKPVKAKEDGEMNGEKYLADYQRAIETKLLKIE